MLSKQSIEAALPLVLQFENAGVGLTAVQGSPLAALVEATYKGGVDVGLVQPVVADNPERALLENIASQMEFMTNARVEQTNDNMHNAIMDNWVKIGTEAVQNHIQVAKNLVGPAVVNLAERVAAKLTELTPAEVAGKDIVTKEINPVIDNDKLLSLVSKFLDGVSIEDPELAMRAGDATADQIRELMLTSIPSLDNSIANWASSLDDQWLTSLWSTVFTGGRQRIYPFAGRGLRSIITDPIDGENAALAIFLLASKIVDDGPNEGSSGGLDHITDLAVRYRNQAAGQLKRQLDYIKESLENGYLVVKKSGGEITVNEPVYNKFLDAGGTNEALLGLLVSGDSKTDMDSILDKREYYERLWETELSFRTETNTTTLFNLKKQLLLSEFKQQCAEDSLDAEEDQFSARARIDQLAGEFQNYLETLVIGDFENLYEVCLKGLTESRFKGTDVYDFLHDIDRIKTENPRLDTRDAATVAEFKYIMRWLISQIRLKSV